MFLTEKPFSATYNVELIADGAHLPQSLLRYAVRFKKPEHIAVITDAMRAAGQSVTESYLGSPDDPVPVVIEDGVAKLLSREAFGGSIATTDRLVRTMVMPAFLLPKRSEW